MFLVEHVMGETMRFEPCSITAYAGFTGDERPRSFLLDGRTVLLLGMRTARVVEDHLTRRRTRYFSAQGADGVEYSFRHDVDEDRWFVAVKT